MLLLQTGINGKTESMGSPPMLPLFVDSITKHNPCLLQKNYSYYTGIDRRIESRESLALFPCTFFQGINAKAVNMEKKLCECGCGQEIDKFDKRGRERFFLKGHQTRLQHIRDKIAKNRIGFKYSEESKKKMSQSHKGKIPSNKGIPCSEEQKRKISEANTGRIRTEEEKTRLRTMNLGRKLSKRTKGRISISKLELGIDKNSLGYCGAFLDEDYKDSIRERDKYTCQDCERPQKNNLKRWGRKLDVHHINGDKSNNHPENLISLCKICHGKADRVLDFRRKK